MSRIREAFCIELSKFGGRERFSGNGMDCVSFDAVGVKPVFSEAALTSLAWAVYAPEACGCVADWFWVAADMALNMDIILANSGEFSSSLYFS